MSIFDIYFKSPLVIGLPPVEPVRPAPAKRLVLFVGDGLRADKCFENDDTGHPRAPFLRDIAKTKGAWGISHTRVPTESRPGHVAMIAGFYEDVSAVTKGWKHNPVEFDHLLKRAKHAWAFGAPEIMHLFPGENVDSYFYTEEMIDFSKDALELDRWSFARLKELFEKAKLDVEVDQKLRGDQVFIFVHLLGLDTNGHAFRPHSKEYHENVSYVDAGIKEAVRMIDSFFNDDKTAYVFTSDHGMSDCGAHGDGDPDNTRCPLIVWGAGISGPQYLDGPIIDEYTKNWTLDMVRRRDINQADLTPLMATLLGIPIPINSEGILPTNYLAESSKFKIGAFLTNVRQLFKILEAKEILRAQHEPFFRGFSHTSASIESTISLISDMIEQGQYDQAKDRISEIVAIILSGLQYYQKYDWLLLRTVVSCGYIGWIVYSILYLHDKLSPPTSLRDHSLLSSSKSGLLFVALGLIGGAYLLAKNAPLQYYAYFAFPLWFAHSSYTRLRREYIRLLLKPSTLGSFLLYAMGMEAMVACFFNRSYFAIITPLICFATAPALDNSITAILLFMSLSSIGLFPLASPITGPIPKLWLLGGCFITIFVSILTFYSARKRITLDQIWNVGACLGSIWIALVGDAAFQEKRTASIFSRFLGWSIVLAAFILPFVTRNRKISAFKRITNVLVMTTPGYIMLSISYEPMFYACYAASLISLLSFAASDRADEQKPHRPKDNRLLGPNMLLLAFNLLVFILLAFFGTGNFASIASFSLPSVYRLITVFSPFTMSALLIGKIFIPIIFLSVAFGAYLRAHNTLPISVFLWLVATIDIITLSFFFLVRDQGSWLEIGTSISHFVISNVFSVIALLIFGLSQLLLTGVDQFEEE